MPIIILNDKGTPNLHYEFDPDLKNVLGEGGMGRVFRGKQGGRQRQRQEGTRGCHQATV
ncbi:MAG: hypothetical protein IJ057_05910 [Bacteroidales bacterium]|nr:hypothetical protein [Bacteroidales bacterium]